MWSSSNGHGGRSGKNLERPISRRALQTRGSAPYKTWVLGFLCGAMHLLGAAFPRIPVIWSVYPPLRCVIFGTQHYLMAILARLRICIALTPICVPHFQLLAPLVCCLHLFCTSSALEHMMLLQHMARLFNTKGRGCWPKRAQRRSRTSY